MTRRGLTMLELLLSLVLLCAIGTSVASWTGLAADLAAGDTSSRLAAADVVLSRIHDDLAVGDRAEPVRRRGPVRVEVIDDRLHIRTRAAGIGPIDHAYILDPVTRDLNRDATDSHGRRTVRRLLDDVRTFTCLIDERDRVLDVTIVLDAGETIHRRCRLP